MKSVVLALAAAAAVFTASPTEAGPRYERDARAAAPSGLVLDGARLHTGPGRHFAVQDYAKRGERVTIGECSRSWCHVRNAAVAGWMPSDQLARALPVRRAERPRDRRDWGRAPVRVIEVRPIDRRPAHWR